MKKILVFTKSFCLLLIMLVLLLGCDKEANTELGDTHSDQSADQNSEIIDDVTEDTISPTDEDNEIITPSSTEEPTQMDAGWRDNHYFDDEGNMVTNNWVDNYFLDSNGDKIELNDNTFIQRGQQIITEDFFFMVPESWNGRVRLDRVENMWFVKYIDGFQLAGEGGENIYPEIFIIQAYANQAEVEEASGMLDNFAELGERNGLIYVSGVSTDSVAEFYAEGQNNEMKTMIQQIGSVRDSFVIRQ